MSATSVAVSPDIQIDIIDVGHGSCIAIRSGDKVSLIDSGPTGSPLLEYLRSEAIEAIHTVVISHADADHIGGLLAMLGHQVPIGRIVWNSDAAKTSVMWQDLVYEIDGLEAAGAMLTCDNAAAGVTIELDGVRLAILAPRTRLRLQGAGAVDRSGHKITSNSMSAVVRVDIGEEALMLVPGDLDAIGFAHLIDDARADLHAQYLVLPHHGGLLGSLTQTEQVIEELTRAVEPSTIFVSNGRGRYDNPRKDVVAAVRRATPQAPIVCTQLSEHCAAVPALRGTLPTPYSAGASRGHACGATTRLTPANGIGTPLNRDDHASFVETHAPTAACVPAPTTGPGGTVQTATTSPAD